METKKSLYKLHFAMGRGDTLEGLFIQYSDKVKKLVDSCAKIPFGEVNGKYSWIEGPLEAADYTYITDDPKVISIIENFNLETGPNPVEIYIEHCREQEQESIFDE